MPDLQAIPTLDTAIVPIFESEANSWSSPPLGYLLLIEESPKYGVLIDDAGNRLLIE